MFFRDHVEDRIGISIGLTGWQKMTTGMIFPRDEEQVRRNCE
jgi:hypothetical protein